MADLHTRLRLHTSLPATDDSDIFERAAREAASAAARVLAEGDFYGRSASVEYEFVVADRTVPSRTPDRSNVVELHQVRVEPVEVTEDGVVVDPEAVEPDLS